MLQEYVTGRSASELAASIEEWIRAGRLAGGEALPPIRELASSLGLSAGTVAAAYKLLNARGLTSADRRRGTRVRELRREELAPVRRSMEVPAGVIDCSTGNPDVRLLPDLYSILGTAHYEPALYGAPLAHPGLLDEARRRLGMDGVPTDALTVSFGALDAMDRMLSSNLAPGDRVAVEDPGWAALIDLVERLGYHAVPIPLDAAGPTPDGVWRALAAGARAIVLTARAQNPTGAAVTPERAAELRSIFVRYPGRLVIEDDHACGLAEVPLAPVVGPTGRYCFVRSFSKGYGADLRLAIAAGDAATIGRLEASIEVGAGWVSHLLQTIALALWQDASVSRLLEDASVRYRERRQALCDELARRDVRVSAPTGLNVWIPVDDEATAVSTLMAEGWLVAPGSRFRIASPPAIRVTTARLGTELAAGCAEAIVNACAAAESKGRRSGSGG